MAVYSIYISYYTDSNNTFQTAEIKLYDLPVAVNHPNLLIEPKVKTEMGKTGSFEFSMYYGHPYYNCWKQMKTMMRVEYYGETIFYGRVLTIDVDHITSKKTIHCEGYLAFLMDSQQEGVPDSERERVAAGTYITSLITNHNTQVNAGSAMATEASPPKAFVRGLVPGNYSGADSNQQIKMESENVKFGSSGWQDTASAFSSLIKEYGGYLRTRYVNANTIYLDWLDAYFRDTAADRVIEVGENVISLSSSAEVENIFTVLIPIGKNSTDSASSDSVFLTPKELYVKDITSVYSDVELNTGYHNKADYQNSLNDYGVIYKVQSFSNADTVDKLRTWAWDWIKNNYHGGLTSFTATAVDMKILGGSSILLAGDQVKVKYPTGTGTAEKIMTVISAEYDLVKPENNSYEIGIPDNELNRSYGEKTEKSSSSKSGASGKGAGGGKKRQETEDDVSNLKNKVDHFWYGHVLDASDDNPDYQAYKEQYGSKASDSILRTTVLTLDYAIDEEGTSQQNKLSKQRLKTWLLDGHNGSMTGYNVEELREQFPNKDDEWLSNYYSTQVSMTLDSFRNGLTFREQIETIGEWAKEDFRTKPLPKMILELGKATLPISETQKAQYGNLAVQRINRGPADVVTEEVKTMMMNGYNGKYVGGKAQFVPSFANDRVQDLFDDTTDSLLGSINLNGTLAELSLTNLPQSVQDIVKTVKAQGNGTNGEGTLFTGWDGSKFLTQMNKEVSYTDGQGQSTSGTGFISSADIEFTNYMPSLKTTLLSVDVLLADYAQIGTLVAMDARIGTIEADYLVADDISARNLASIIATIDLLSVQALSASLEIQGASGRFGRLYLAGNAFTDTMVKNASVSGDTLTLTLLNGSHVTFSKPEEVSVEDSRSAGTYTTNGYKTVTPSSGYDAMAEVTFRVNVSTSSGGGGCFAAGSMVRLADGSEMPIEKLTPGLILASYDSEQDKFCETEVMSLKQFKHRDDVFELRLANGKAIVLTDSHPLYTKGGWKAIDPEKAKEEHHNIEVTKLTVDDSIFGVDGYVEIESVEYREDLRDCTVYNIDVEEADTYIVDGIVAHNADDK